VPRELGILNESIVLESTLTIEVVAKRILDKKDVFAKKFAVKSAAQDKY
jgi:hypothetical protein